MMQRFSQRWLVTGFSAFVALGILSVLVVSAHAEEAAKPMIVKIHADWCGTCTKLNTTFDELEEKLGGDATLVILDVTDREAVARSQAEADRLGIRAFFDANKGKTGTVGVIAANGEVLRVLKGELDAAKYVAALREASRDSAS